MNHADPILILQMQRMGDLVLSFPLTGWLKSLHPDTAIWVVGEKAFYDGLVELSPPLTYFSYADSHVLEPNSYSLIINLSHRPEAAALSGRLKAARRIGPYADEHGSLRINGAWQLYRASISHNNRHNLFHWADLNAMDLIPPISMMRTVWPPVKETPAGAAPRIGLFVGASEPDKRPDPEFWANLAKRLLQSGAKPVFLGGEADLALAGAAANILRAPAMNLSGKFSIIQLCQFIAELDLLIVPDTGPMHIAAWTGAPVLNLSIGPVNPWETAPFAPGHHVLRSSPSCTGCWACTQPRVICKERLKAEQVGLIAELLLERSSSSLARLDSAAGHVYRTRRDAHGLFDLEQLNLRIDKERGQSLRRNIALYWKLFFGQELGFISPTEQNSAELGRRRELVFSTGPGDALLSAGKKMLAALSRAIQGRADNNLKTGSFWLSFPPAARPLASYIQLILHNDDFSRQAITAALRTVESFVRPPDPHP